MSKFASTIHNKKLADSFLLEDDRNNVLCLNDSEYLPYRAVDINAKVSHQERKNQNKIIIKLSLFWVLMCDSGRKILGWECNCVCVTVETNMTFREGFFNTLWFQLKIL
jgi:hypothetical protein